MAEKKNISKEADRPIRNIKLQEDRKPVKYKVVEIKRMEAVQNQKKKTSDSSPDAALKNGNNRKAQALNNSPAPPRHNTSKIKRDNRPSQSDSNNNEEDTNSKYKDLAKIQQVAKSNKHNTNTTNVAGSSSSTANTAVRTAQQTQQTQREKAAALAAKLKADVELSAKTQSAMKSYAVDKAKVQERKAIYKKNLSPESKARFDKAVNNTLKREISDSKQYQSAKSKAAVHYKKMTKLNMKVKLFGQKIKKAEKTAHRNENVLKTVETAAAIVTDPKKVVERAAINAIRKTKLGNAVVNTTENYLYIDNKMEADNLSDAAVNTATALPEKIIREKVTNTITNVATGRSHANQLNKSKNNAKKKYSSEQRRAQRSERAANRAKEAAIRKSKVQFYKEKKGIAKTGELIKDAKQTIKQFSKVAEKAVTIAVQEGGKAAIAAVLPVILVILLIIIVIVILFSWTDSWTDNVYDNSTGEYSNVMYNSEKDVLNGYITHIQQYFDKKQLDILKKVDYEFGGWEPDEYEYNAGITPGVTPEAHTYRYYKYKLYCEEYIEANGIKTKADDVGGDVIFEQYYFKHYRDGYFLCEPGEAEDTVSIMSTTLSVEDFYPVNVESSSFYHAYCTYEPSVLQSGDRIDNMTVTIKSNTGVVLYKDTALNFIMNHVNTLNLAMNKYLPYDDDTQNKQNSHAPIVHHTYENFQLIAEECPKFPLPAETDDDTLLAFDNHIWELYQFDNKWIKLSDQCDFESIIALAAVKHYREITADDFDSTTYNFALNDSDLDEILNEICTFSYTIAKGQCPSQKCHREVVDGHYVYSCSRTSDNLHEILQGNVVNYEYIYDSSSGDISFIRNRLHLTAEECEIYDVYREYIEDVLGTHTYLDDYEHNQVAQKRLKDMYEAENGSPLDKPTNVSYTVTQETGSDGISTYDIINLSWNPVKDAQYYNVYAYDPTNDAATKVIASPNTTSCSFKYVDGWSKITRAAKPTYVLVTAVNDKGESKHTPGDAVLIKVK